MNQSVGDGTGAPKTPGIAIASLVLGIFGVVGACLTGIPAVICGHLALSRIGKSNGALGGKGIAIAGTVIGYVAIAWSVLLIPALTVPIIGNVQDRGMQTKLVANARQIFLGCKVYSVEHDGRFPESLEQLVEEGMMEDGPVFLVPGMVDMDHEGEAMFRLVTPGANEIDLDPAEAVIVSRFPVSLRRDAGWVMVRADGSCQVVSRSELEAMGVEVGNGEMPVELE